MDRKTHFLHFLFRITALLLACLTAGFCSPAAAREDSAARGGVVMVCPNIGKADAILLRGDSWAYLVDTGYAQSYPALCVLLEEYGVDRLDGVFLTHCHKDHYGSLSLLAQSSLPVGAWYASAVYYDVRDGKHPMEAAAAVRNDKVTWLRAGDTVTAGEDASFTVLGPLTADTGNENNNSLVMRFQCPWGSILLTGDMKEDEEHALLDAGLIPSCDILKCGHHGGNGATCKALLRAVRPAFAVICTASGEEEDTPGAKVLARLNAAGTRVYVTQDARDAVEFTLAPGGITVRDKAWEHVPERVRGLGMAIDPEGDVLVITNPTGSDLTIEEAVLYSSKGTELYPLGDLYIPAGACVTVGSAVSEAGCSLYLPSKGRVWHKSKRDTAVLYDRWGRPLAWADNGMPE